MNFLMLTRTVGNIPIISIVYSWLVNIMGYIMDIIFRFTSLIGINNIGVCIILFTLVTRIILLPMSYRQSKSQRLMSVVQPEIQAIQKKYKGKTDQQSMAMMQAETKAVYDRYGASMSGGCIQLLIQMPIIFALYKVIINIPAYVGSVKLYFENIVTALGGASAISAVNTFAHSTDELTKVITTARISGGEILTTDHIIDFLYHLSPSQWDSFKQAFSYAGDVISSNYAYIEEMNSFLGINLATPPSSYGLLSIKAWVIPLLAGLTQFLATKLMQSATAGLSASGDDATAQTMKTMNLMMPLMSIFFCFSFASGIGVYWVTSSALMGLQQYFINKRLARVSTDDLIKENLARINKKRARKGEPPINEVTAAQNLKKMQEKADRLARLQEQRQAANKQAQSASESYYSTSSIADRANMVAQYEQRKNKNKKDK